MRTYPSDDEMKEAEKLKAEPWMLDCLKLNPEYVHWGPREDYMYNTGDGWSGRVLRPTWKDFGPWTLDELNELAHFYFFVRRESKECEACGGSGYNQETRRISDTFYGKHGGWDLDGWCDKITQDEAQALVDAGRLRDFTHTFVAGDGWVEKDPPRVPSADEINAWQRGRGMGHDAINRWILIEARAKRLGVWGRCETCSGEGSVFTEPAAKLGLTLWWLHPRKGASRGIEIAEISREDVPAALSLLSEAATRNAERFAKAVSAAREGYGR